MPRFPFSFVVQAQWFQNSYVFCARPWRSEPPLRSLAARAPGEVALDAAATEEEEAPAEPEASPPLACIFGMSRLYSICIPPVSHSISSYPAVSLYLHLAILQKIHGIPLYLTVSSCIRTYLAVSRCISLYPTASKTGYDQKYIPGEG